jgi:Nif11 domain
MLTTPSAQTFQSQIEIEIEALFGPPQHLPNRPKGMVLPLNAEQSEQLMNAKTEQEAVALLREWGYDIFAA